MNENQFVVKSEIMGFMNAQQAQNEAFGRSGSPHINGGNTGGNRHFSEKKNLPKQIWGKNTNNRDDMSQISYYRFGSIINWLPKGLAKFTINEVNVV